MWSYCSSLCPPLNDRHPWTVFVTTSHHSTTFRWDRFFPTPPINKWTLCSVSELLSVFFWPPRSPNDRSIKFNIICFTFFFFFDGKNSPSSSLPKCCPGLTLLSPLVPFFLYAVRRYFLSGPFLLPFIRTPLPSVIGLSFFCWFPLFSLSIRQPKYLV